MNARARLASLFACLMSTALVAGQAPPAPPASQSQPATPTFRVRVDYVEVDTVVTDKQGRLVSDLKKEDFQVLEDGKAQTIAAFTTVNIPIERYDRPLFSALPIDPDVTTNETPFDGRVYVMVIDDLHTRFGRSNRVKVAAKQFIEQRLGANDLMAVVHTAGPSNGNQEFTSNKRLLLAAVDKTNGRKLDSATISKANALNNSRGGLGGGPLNDPDDAERTFNARSTLDTLRNVAEWFGSVRGRRKAILFVSEGIDYDINDLIPAMGSSHQGASTIIDATREAISAATRSNVAIYGIDPRGLTDLGDESIELGSFADDRLGAGPGSLQNEIRLSQDSLRTLSEETGGFAVVNRNDFTGSFQRIVEDNSSYYVLAYYPPDPQPGRFHKIDVRVTRPGLNVRARKAYVAPKKPDEKLAAARAKSPMTPEVREALDSPLPVSGLTMHVFLSPFKGAAPNASVLMGVELRGSDLKLSQSDSIQLSYVAVDAGGKIRGGNTDSLTMAALKPETKARIEQSGLRLLNRMDLPPGKYQVRVAAQDSSAGNVGAIQAELEVPDFAKQPFSISGLVFTSPASSQLPTARPDEQLRTVMPGPPVARRTFAQNDEVTLFAEVYDNEGKTPHKVDITSTVMTDEGKVMFKTDETRDSSDLGGKNGGYGYTAKIPMKDLAAGRYVLKVEAKSRLKNADGASREVQFFVEPAQAGAK